MIPDAEHYDRSIHSRRGEGRRARKYAQVQKQSLQLRKQNMNRRVPDSAVTEITAAPRGPVSRQPNGGRRFNGWSLGNVEDFYREKEAISLMFSDPLIENEYCEYCSRTSLRSDVLSMGISSIVALTYLMKGDFRTYPAQILRTLVLIGVFSNLIRLSTLKISPTLAQSYRQPFVLALSWYSHIVMACLPPLSYGSLKTPSTSWGAYWVSPQQALLAAFLQFLLGFLFLLTRRFLNYSRLVLVDKTIENCFGTSTTLKSRYWFLQSVVFFAHTYILGFP